MNNKSEKIFINYRYADDPGNAGRLYDNLLNHYAKDSLFINNDVQSKLGLRVVVERMKSKNDIFLCVIGKNWLVQDENNQPLLNNPEDYVRLEIEAALFQKIDVVLVLVNDAIIPKQEELPETLRALDNCKAIRLSHERFRADIFALIRTIDGIIDFESTRCIVQETTEQVLRERQIKQQVLQENNSAYSVAIDLLSPDQASGSPEIKNWEKIRNSFSPVDFQDHIARFSAGVFKNTAKNTLESIVWSKLPINASVPELLKFLEEFPQGQYSEQAKNQLHAIKNIAELRQIQKNNEIYEEADWKNATLTDTISIFQSYINQWPDSKRVGLAKTRISDLVPKKPLIISHEAEVSCLAFSPYEKIIATASNDNVIQVLDYAKQKSLSKFKSYWLGLSNFGKGVVSSMAFSSDGNILISGSDDGVIRLWDLESSKLISSLNGHTGLVKKVAFSPYDQILASASYDKTIRLWDIASKKTIATISTSQNLVLDVAFSRDGKTLASASTDGSIRLWDVFSQKMLAVLKGHSSEVYSVAFWPDEKTLTSACHNEIRQWEMPSLKNLATLEATQSDYHYIDFSPNGNLIASTAHNNIRLWNISTRYEVALLKSHTASVRNVCFSYDGRTLASVSSDRTVRLWDVSRC